MGMGLEGMGMSILENNGNGTKCLVGMGMGRNGKSENHSCAPLIHTLLIF